MCFNDISTRAALERLNFNEPGRALSRKSGIHVKNGLLANLALLLNARRRGSP